MSDETTRLIAQTADDLFAAESAAARAELAEGSWPERLWRTFAETGLAQAALPEEAGGAGLAAGLAVLRAAGRHAAPIPATETMVGGLLCHAAGIEAPDGPLTVHVLPDGTGAGGAAVLSRIPFALRAAAPGPAASGRAGRRPVPGMRFESDTGGGRHMTGTNQPEVHRGLKDLCFDRSPTTLIDGRAGELRYRGYSIHDLAARSCFEETAYLLLHGELPTNVRARRLRRVR